MSDNEKTSPQVGRIASRILQADGVVALCMKDGKVSIVSQTDLKALAASALTQRPDHKRKPAV